uniref:HCV F-transactivated protein 1 n=1 Tax=Gallus gallus TaxID=9031 RepID=A0A8V0XV54_CHICK
MEAAVRRRRPRPEERSAADGERPPALSGQSYWLDLWLFVLFDVALFVFIYLLP